MASEVSLSTTVGRYFYPQTDLSPFVDVTGFIVIDSHPSRDESSASDLPENGQSVLFRNIEAFIKDHPWLQILSFTASQPFPSAISYMYRHSAESPEFTEDTVVRFLISGRVFDRYLDDLALLDFEISLFDNADDAYSIQNLELFAVDMLGNVQHVGGSHPEYRIYQGSQVSKVAEDRHFNEHNASELAEFSLDHEEFSKIDRFQVNNELDPELMFEFVVESATELDPELEFDDEPEIELVFDAEDDLKD